MFGDGDLHRVAELMRETAAAELLPRFRKLAGEDIRQKRPGDVVTVADVASEQRLASGLAKIMPGVAVVGEESVEEDAALLNLIGRRGESCWVVDPLDGTSNFAAGRDRFAMIVCLIHDRETVAGWILDAPSDRMAMAVKGQGVTLDNRPVRLQAKSRRPSGYVGFKMIREFNRQLASTQRRRLGDLTSLNCAGREYIDVLTGLRDFTLYRRTKPWDHAAGALMVSEGGGQSVCFNGTPYSPAGSMEDGIITAVSPQVLAEVKAILEVVEMPLLAPRD